MPSIYQVGGNVGANWGPPSGLVAAWAQRNQEMEEAANASGGLAGGLAGGAIGAFQGAATPQVLGKETSLGGAWQGFWQNVASQGGVGGGDIGGGVGGFAGMLGGGGGEGGGGMSSFTGGGRGGGAMNVMQLRQLNKTADSMRDFAKLMPEFSSQKDPRVFGKTDDEWKISSAMDKGGAIQSYINSMRLESQLQG